MPRRQGGGERDRIEMARMVGDHHIRRLGREVLGADDGEMVIGLKIKACREPPGQMGEARDQPGLALQAGQSGARREAEIGGGLELPVLHRRSPAAEDSGRLVEAEADEISEVMEGGGRHQQQAVRAVEDAAMARDDGAGVLDAEIALDR